MNKHKYSIIANIFGFYILPFLIIDTGSAMMVLLIMVPLIIIGSCFYDAWHNGFKWYLPLIVMALFIPTIFLYYNTSAIFYIFFYGFIALMSSLIGYFIHAIYLAKKKD